MRHWKNRSRRPSIRGRNGRVQRPRISSRTLWRETIDMQQERSIGHVEQVPPGEGRNFDVDGTVITVFRTRTEGVFATQPRCPHKGGRWQTGCLAARCWSVRCTIPHSTCGPVNPSRATAGFGPTRSGSPKTGGSSLSASRYPPNREVDRMIHAPGTLRAARSWSRCLIA